jgi:hypothetical protein
LFQLRFGLGAVMLLAIDSGVGSPSQSIDSQNGGFHNHRDDAKCDTHHNWEDNRVKCQNFGVWGVADIQDAFIGLPRPESIRLI